MGTYEQLSKVQINVLHFQLFVTIFAFCETIWGYGLPHPYFVDCFRISANHVASFKVGAYTVVVWVVGSKVCCNIPAQALCAIGMERAYDWLVMDAKGLCWAFIHSTNNSCTFTMCWTSQLRPGIDFLSLETNTDQEVWDIMEVRRCVEKLIHTQGRGLSCKLLKSLPSSQPRSIRLKPWELKSSHLLIEWQAPLLP